MMGMPIPRTRRIQNLLRPGESLGHAQWKGAPSIGTILIRREVIKRLICDFSLNFAAVEQAHGLVLARGVFCRGSQAVADLHRRRSGAHDRRGAGGGLHWSVVDPQHLHVLDVYLRSKARQQQFSGRF